MTGVMRIDYLLICKTSVSGAKIFSTLLKLAESDALRKNLRDPSWTKVVGMSLVVCGGKLPWEIPSPPRGRL